MKILLMGDMGAGKSSYYEYIRALFIIKQHDMRNKQCGDYSKRTSVARNFFQLGEDVIASYADNLPATQNKYEYKFELYYNLSGWERVVIGDSPMFDEISFIDVPGGIYEEFTAVSLPDKWGNKIPECDALIIVIDGENLCKRIEDNNTYTITNLLNNAVSVAKNKNIPARIIITHADDFNGDSQGVLEKGIKAITTKIPYTFVDIQARVGQDLNSHKLDNPLRRAGQIPFFEMLKTYVEKKVTIAENNERADNWLTNLARRARSVFVPSETELYRAIASNIEQIIWQIEQKQIN